MQLVLAVAYGDHKPNDPIEVGAAEGARLLANGTARRPSPTPVVDVEPDADPQPAATQPTASQSPFTLPVTAPVVDEPVPDPTAAGAAGEPEGDPT